MPILVLKWRYIRRFPPGQFLDGALPGGGDVARDRPEEAAHRLPRRGRHQRGRQKRFEGRGQLLCSWRDEKLDSNHRIFGFLHGTEPNWSVQCSVLLHDMIRCIKPYLYNIQGDSGGRGTGLG